MEFFYLFKSFKKENIMSYREQCIRMFQHISNLEGKGYVLHLSGGKEVQGEFISEEITCKLIPFGTNKEAVIKYHYPTIRGFNGKLDFYKDIGLSEIEKTRLELNFKVKFLVFWSRTLRVRLVKRRYERDCIFIPVNKGFLRNLVAFPFKQKGVVKIRWVENSSSVGETIFSSDRSV